MGIEPICLHKSENFSSQQSKALCFELYLALMTDSPTLDLICQIVLSSNLKFKKFYQRNSTIKCQ